jgi:hypothetical protein
MIYKNLGSYFECWFLHTETEREREREKKAELKLEGSRRKKDSCEQSENGLSQKL